MDNAHQEHAKVFKALCDPKASGNPLPPSGRREVRLRFDGPVGNGTIRRFLSHEDSMRIGYCREPSGREMDPLQPEQYGQQGRC